MLMADCRLRNRFVDFGSRTADYRADCKFTDPQYSSIARFALRQQMAQSAISHWHFLIPGH
jgi:hypothetical protein